MARLAPFSQMTYVLQEGSYGFLTHLVPTMMAHGSDDEAAAVGAVVEGDVVDAIPVVSVVPVTTGLS